MTRTEIIQKAIYAALGCTKIDFRSPKSVDGAAAQITKFVEAALDEQNPKWVRDYEAELMSDGGPSLSKQSTH